MAIHSRLINVYTGLLKTFWKSFACKKIGYLNELPLFSKVNKDKQTWNKITKEKWKYLPSYLPLLFIKNEN